MKLTFIWLDRNNRLDISRKLKKKKKKQIIEEIYGKSIKSLKSKKVGLSKIYYKQNIDFSIINKNLEEGNYYLSHFFVNREKIFFLMDIGKPIFIIDKYYIYPKEKNIVKLIKEGLGLIYFTTPPCLIGGYLCKIGRVVFC